jgi:hypothetical protein
MSENLERQLLALGADWRSAIPQPLRMRITTIAQGAADSAPTPEVSPPRVWRSPVVAGAALVAFVVLLVAIPGARVSIARQGFRVLQALRIAPGTQLQTDDAQTADEVNASLRQTQRQLNAGRGWFVSTVYGGLGGSVREGVSPDVRRIDRLDVLSSLAPMPLIGPDGVYRGERLTFHHALLAPDGVVVLTFFCYGDTEVFLVQAVVGHGHQVAYSRSVSGPGGTVIGVAPSIEVLTVNGQRLTWDPDTTGIMPNSSALRWEANGISYSLYGQALTREEAVALFSSLRPLN